MKRLSVKFQKLCESETEHCLYWFSIWILLFVAAVYAGTYFIAEYTGIDALKECAMKKFFKIPCPGCGGTRALINLFTGRIGTAVYYNAFAVYVVVMYLIFFVTQTLQRITNGKIRGAKFRDIYWKLAIGVLIVQYVAKFLVPGYVV